MYPTGRSELEFRTAPVQMDQGGRDIAAVGDGDDGLPLTHGIQRHRGRAQHGNAVDARRVELPHPIQRRTRIRDEPQQLSTQLRRIDISFGDPTRTVPSGVLTHRVLEAVTQRGTACGDEQFGVRVLQHEGEDRPGGVLVVDPPSAQHQQHGHHLRGRQPEKQCPRGLVTNIRGIVSEPHTGARQRLQQHPGPLALVHTGHEREQQVLLRIVRVRVPVEFRVVPRHGTCPGQRQGRAVGAEVVEDNCGVHSRSVGTLTLDKPSIFRPPQPVSPARRSPTGSAGRRNHSWSNMMICRTAFPSASRSIASLISSSRIRAEISFSTGSRPSRHICSYRGISRDGTADPR